MPIEESYLSSHHEQKKEIDSSLRRLPSELTG
jgi:hypothetical protein